MAYVRLGRLSLLRTCHPDTGAPVFSDVRVVAVSRWPSDEAVEDLIGYIWDQRRTDRDG
jgi:hypothetical protein